MLNIKVQMGHRECRKRSKNMEEGCARECLYTHTQNTYLYACLHTSQKKKRNFWKMETNKRRNVEGKDNSKQKQNKIYNIYV